MNQTPPGQHESIEAFSQVVTALYESALDWDRWAETLRIFANAFGADNVVMVIRPSAPDDPGYIITDEIIPDLEALGRYQSGWYNADPLLSLPYEQVVIGSEIISAEE